MAGKRPTPHVDNSEANADAAFTPTLTPASAPVPFVNVLMHGDNGTGKTHAAGTFPKPIFLSLDPGFATLRKLPNSEDIHIVRIPDPSRGDRAPLMQLWDVVLWLERGDHDRETVVLDSITELHKMVLKAVMAKKPRATVPDTDDYIEVNDKVESLARKLRDLPMNTVFTAHHKVLKKKDDVIGIRPNLSDKLSTSLGGMCDLVMHTSAHERERDGQTRIVYVGQTVPLNGVQAKDRSGLLRTPYALLDWQHIAVAYGIAEDDINPAPVEPSEPEQADDGMFENVDPDYPTAEAEAVADNQDVVTA